MIVITGAEGFVGGALYLKIKQTLGPSAVCSANRDFTNFPKNTKVIYHLAYKHRLATNSELIEANTELDFKLLESCAKLPQLQRIVFCSSIHEEGPSAYGVCKRLTDSRITEYCKNRNIQYNKYVLRNTFGPGARPYRWSFVATFCADLISGKESKIQSNILELHYIDDVVNALFSLESDNIRYWEVNVEDIYAALSKISRGALQPVDELEFRLKETYIYYASTISST